MIRPALLFGLTLVSFSALAEGGYQGPSDPEIPADHQLIQARLDQCLTDIKEIVEWSPQDARKAAEHLCHLRREHIKARRELRQEIAHMIAAYKDFLNHGHADAVPQTIKVVHETVDLCIKAFSLHQNCHNIGCAMEPEENAIFCDRHAASLVRQIYMPLKHRD